MADPLQLMALARAECAAGRPAGAATLLESVLEQAPDLLAAHIDLGALLVTLGRPEEAARRLRVAVALDPGNVEAQVNLGNALHAQGQLAAAESTYRTALGLDPAHCRGLLSLGNLLVQVRRPGEAIELLSAAVALAPGAVAPYQFLGNALRDLGRIDEAIAVYRQAIALEPATPDANESLGSLFKAQERHEEALACFRASGNPQARALALECLLRLGRPAEFFTQLAAHRAEESTNLHSASLSAYAAWHLGRPDPHPFCPEPLSQVRILDRYTGPGRDARFLQELIHEASQVNAVWEPRGVTTKKGFQTGGNLFAHGDAHGALARFQQELLQDLDRYRTGLMPPGLTLATHWPRNMRLQGWFVRLLTGGHQYFHNHPFGWLSGCLYLQMPAAASPGEGAIEFGLESGGYPPLSDRPSPTLLHVPKPGQIALFPSSLYHRTIPFSSDEERLCIAFDLLPG